MISAENCGGPGCPYPEAHLDDTFREASRRVAEEQTRYAEAFLRFKARTGTSDGQAREQATVETGAALTVALAEQEIARIRLQNS